MQPAATGTILVGEQAVGIEVVGDALTKLRDDPGVDPGRMPDQGALGGCDIGR